MPSLLERNPGFAVDYAAQLAKIDRSGSLSTDALPCADSTDQRPVEAEAIRDKYSIKTTSHEAPRRLEHALLLSAAEELSKLRDYLTSVAAHLAGTGAIPKKDTA